jgi:DNA gyrase inhibitor GyrI
MYDITVQDVPETRVVSEHLEVPSHLGAVTEAATLAALATKLMQRGIEPVAQPILVIHHADEQRTREDACLPVDDDADLDPEFHVDVLPGGEMATATHVGPLDDLALVVTTVMGWVCSRWHPKAEVTSPLLACSSRLREPERVGARQSSSVGAAPTSQRMC